MQTIPVASKTVKTRRGRVFSKRNSSCNVPLDWLDRNNWFMDAWKTDAWRYIHVEGAKAHPEEEKYRIAARVFRVYPRNKADERVRLEMKDGELWWIFDRETP